jgi:hypothetical protein
VLVFFVVGPLNYVLSGRAAKIYVNMQEVSLIFGVNVDRPSRLITSQARDKKMSVLNEMISEIKFIKFLASEAGWMKRALDARAKELKLIRQSIFMSSKCPWSRADVPVVRWIR